jgi:hypothetical protein
VFLVSAAVDVLVEAPVIALGLWTYTEPSWMSIPFGKAMRYPLAEAIAGGCYFSMCASVRIFKDDHGRTIVERGVDHLSPARRAVVSLLALYTIFQFVVWIPANVPVIVLGPYQEQWPRLPRWEVNDVCDAPGITGTRYGLCPGSPGYKMPIRGQSRLGPGKQ